MPTNTQYYGLDHTEPIHIKEIHKLDLPEIDEKTGEVIEGKQTAKIRQTCHAWDGPRSVDLHERTEAHVASDAINSFLRSGLSAQQGIMIVLVVIMAAAGLLWYTNGERFDELQLQLQSGQNNSVIPAPTPIGGVTPNGGR